MPALRKYPPELRERAMRLVAEARKEDPELSVTAVVTRIGQRVGVNPDTLRGWVKQQQIDAGERPGTTTSEALRIKALEAEVPRTRRPRAAREHSRSDEDHRRDAGEPRAVVEHVPRPEGPIRWGHVAPALGRGQVVSGAVCDVDQRSHVGTLLWRATRDARIAAGRPSTCPLRLHRAGSSPGAPRSMRRVAGQPARYRQLPLVNLNRQ